MSDSTTHKNIAIIGGDMRQNYLADYFLKLGHTVTCYKTPQSPLFHYSSKAASCKTASSVEEALSQSTIIVGPVPFSKDQKTIYSDTDDRIPLSELYSFLEDNHFLIGGNIPPAVLRICKEKAVPSYDFMKSESLAYLNAEITAEGILSEILGNTPFILQNTSVLILGYGKCGTILAHKLNALGCLVSVCDTLYTRRSLASSFGLHALSPSELKENLLAYSILINTVPAPVLTEEAILLLSPTCCLFDLASAPGGIDWEAARKHHIKALNCPGMPGKTAPLTAGEAIGRDIITYLENYY